MDILEKAEKKPWTPEEEKVLVSLADLPPKEIAPHLPNRTATAILLRLYKLRGEGRIEKLARRDYRRWSKIEDEWLSEHRHESLEFLASSLSRSAKQINARLGLLGRKRKKSAA